MSEDEKLSTWRQHNERVKKSESEMASSIRSWLRDLKHETLRSIQEARIHHGWKAGDDQSKEKPANEVLDRTAIGFDPAEWFRKLSKVLSVDALAALQTSYEDFIRRYEIDGQVFAPNSSGVQRAVARVVNKTKTVPVSVLDQLSNQIDEGLRLQETVPELARRVDAFFNATSDYRARRIAQTVANYAVNEGNNLAATESGSFRSKVWITMRDDKVRDLHRPLDGQEIAINEKFSLLNGDHLEVPGDPSGRGESVINCRCTAVFVQ